ncbi:MAG: ABC transporter ATP-binding protein [Syntrophales bacterium]|nr:ABC transporter ATP-binding protein [Syntrophales bacterium]
MLEIKNISKHFGGVKALQDVSLTLNEGEFLGLIGPNGSGKTTLFNVISGMYKPTSGSIIFNNQRLTGLTSDKVCHAGIARTFQIPKPIMDISVLENVMLGLIFGKDGSSHHSKLKETQEEALKLMEFVELDVDPYAYPSELTAGDLRRLELVKAIATHPKILLADEVLSGLNHDELEGAAKVLQKVRNDKKIAIVWVEHIMGVLMGLVDRVVVLNYGKLIADGTPAEISTNQEVIDAYLGE